MHWLWVVLIGLVVGALAKFIMPGKDPGGFIVTILIGIAGSLVATWLGRAIGLYQEGQSAGFIMSVVGAIVLLGIYHLVRPKTAEPSGETARDPGEGNRHALDTGWKQ